MAAVPSWSAARSGLLGDTGAVDHAAQIDQFLGTHPATTVYNGAQILQPVGTGGSPGSLNLGAADWDQPFTMSGTAIGRVVVPVAPIGNGADLTVSLFTDSGGSPNTLITSTRIAAKALLALVATATLSASSAPPLATSASNTLTGSPGTTVSYPSPALSAAGLGANTTTVQVGNNMLMIGGETASSQAVASVFSISYTGGTTLAPPVPQPNMPQALMLIGAAATPDTLVVASGSVPGSGGVASVFTAPLNPATGNIGAWSVQTSLPQALGTPAVAASGENIYVIGGVSSASVNQNTVYHAVVQNGQITAWTALAPFPRASSTLTAVVVNGFLVVVETNSATTYYAAINADGSLGAWATGPHVPYVLYNVTAIATDTGVVLLDAGPGSSTVTETLTFGPNGPAPAWQVQTNAIPASEVPVQMALFPVGNGAWQLFSILSASYFTQQISLVPAVSVPLPATGLTNAATYHVVLSQAGGDAADYLVAGVDQNVFPGNPTAKSRARSGGSTWTATTAGQAIPIQAFDQSAGGAVLHAWADSGARHGTLVTATTPDVRLQGVIEHAAQPAPVLNINPTFTAGTAPWAATGGALTQSSAHTRGQLPFSGLLTPSGVASSSFIESEQVAVFQGHSYVATAWLFSPVGYANVAVNINWYSAAHALLSTTSGTVTALAANTWTQYATTGAVPASAAYGTIVPIETGTPPATALLYVSAATLQDASGPMLPSIAQVNYGGNWPSAAAWPPLSVSQLA